MRGRSADSGNNGVKEKEEEEEEESLSLCDLPINGENQSRKESSIPKPTNIESQEEFNFCGTVISKESEMCAADEVFFQGQILPLRHSVSCDSGVSIRLQNDIRNASRCISSSDSMDHCYSGGLTSASSRSSSINSHHSSSSGNSSATSTATTNSKHKQPRPPRVRNHFQYSQPSPKPQIRPSSIKNANSTNSIRNSGLLSLFRLGLMTPPEIAIQDLKNRSNSNKNSIPNFGSRNSSSSSNISSSSNRSKLLSAKRKQPFFLNKDGVLFGGCKCTVSSVGPNPSRIAVDRRTGVSAKEEANAHEEKQQPMKMTKHQQAAGKQALSRHRTFEWLKQLSLEAAMDQT